MIHEYTAGPNGEVTGYCASPFGGLLGNDIIIADGFFNREDYYHDFATGTLVKIPIKPSNDHVFNYVTKQWEDQRTLEQVKRAADQRINAARLQANQTSFTYLGKEIAADPLSRSDIDAINGEVANAGAFPAGWPGGWKCIDNTYVAITTVDDWKAFYTAMVNQGLVNFAHAQTLKAQIAAATTIAEVEAVQW